jgi:hypothetical protein
MDDQNPTGDTGAETTPETPSEGSSEESTS